MRQVCVCVCIAVKSSHLWDFPCDSSPLTNAVCVRITRETGFIRTHGKIWKSPPCQSNGGFASLMVWADRQCKHCVTSEMNYLLFTWIYKQFITEKERFFWLLWIWYFTAEAVYFWTEEQNRTNPSWSNIQTTKHTHIYIYMEILQGQMMRNWVIYTHRRCKLLYVRSNLSPSFTG